MAMTESASDGKVASSKKISNAAKGALSEIQNEE
jgi:hypothetical protein